MQVRGGVLDLALLGVIENIFTWEDEPGHEAVFVYEGRFADASAYERRRLDGIEEDGTLISATWRPLEFFDDHNRLVPEGLLAFLTGRDEAAR